MKFIDLFAGIGGIRMAFERVGAECVFSSEWNRFAQQTYAANFGETPHGDIRSIEASEIPAHDILCGGFPCQPFSIAGVSKKISMGRKHGFEDEEQGNLFFEILRIAEFHKPQLLFLENVRNLISHDKGRTLQTVQMLLTQAGYHVSWQLYDAAAFVPQHRERIIIIGCRTQSIVMPPKLIREMIPLKSILQSRVDPRYTLSDKLWTYLQHHAAKHQERGNGFGFGLADRNGITRTLSARYYKDGSEILIPQRDHNPRRLSPRECARIMGFPESFIIPVSDTQAYRQFGNSVCVPMMEYVARGVVAQLIQKPSGTQRTCIASLTLSGTRLFSCLRATNS